MKAVTTVALTSLLLTGCVSVSPVESLRAASEAEVAKYASAGKAFLLAGGAKEALIQKSQEALANQLKDPESAKFRNIEVREISGGTIVCGDVNAKNSYGGYTGYVQFVAGPTGGMLQREEKSILDSAELYGLFINCGRR